MLLYAKKENEFESSSILNLQEDNTSTGIKILLFSVFLFIMSVVSVRLKY